MDKITGYRHFRLRSWISMFAYRKKRFRLQIHHVIFIGYFQLRRQKKSKQIWWRWDFWWWCRKVKHLFCYNRLNISNEIDPNPHVNLAAVIHRMKFLPFKCNKSLSIGFSMKSSPKIQQKTKKKNYPEICQHSQFSLLLKRRSSVLNNPSAIFTKCKLIIENHRIDLSEP